MNYYKYLLFSFILILFGCGKEFLEIKQNKNQVIPTSISDFQALLDDASENVNSKSCNELGLIGSDDYFLSDQVWANLPIKFPYEKTGYLWAKDNVYEEQQVTDWDYSYKKILIANTALDGLENTKPTQSNQSSWNNVKGSALFIRAFVFYQLAQEFCLPYNHETAHKDLGIPIRLKADITAKGTRGTVSGTYLQILNDLTLAAEFLPNEPLTKYRPSKAAAFAVLARVYLQMGNYEEAGRYADLSLKINNSLIDFNTINVNAAYSFPVNMEKNPEIIYITIMNNIAMVNPSRLRVDHDLYNSYDDDDLGKEAYFVKKIDNTYSYKGSYAGDILPLFTGLAVDEMLLIRAECLARNGNLSEAMADLNYLLMNRYDIAQFKSLIFNAKEELLDAIIDQRRKRLVFRGTRWEDLRRLNKEVKYKKTLVRQLNGVRHELPPNDLRYVWPIPDKAITLGGYTQNPR